MMILIIATINLFYKIYNPNFEHSFFVFYFIFPYLVMRKTERYKSLKKVFNIDTWRIEFKGFGNVLEIILIVEIYFCTVQFDKGILIGLTTNFGDNIIFSIIPCLLMYRFIVYKSLELGY
ncbi:hypothetical protein RyT2_14520 [Pseudolactococcus yaeyamensis]